MSASVTPTLSYHFHQSNQLIKNKSNAMHMHRFPNLCQYRFTLECLKCRVLKFNSYPVALVFFLPVPRTGQTASSAFCHPSPSFSSSLFFSYDKHESSSTFGVQLGRHRGRCPGLDSPPFLHLDFFPGGPRAQLSILFVPVRAMPVWVTTAATLLVRARRGRWRARIPEGWPEVRRTALEKA